MKHFLTLFLGLLLTLTLVALTLKAVLNSKDPRTDIKTETETDIETRNAQTAETCTPKTCSSKLHLDIQKYAQYSALGSFCLESCLILEDTRDITRDITWDITSRQSTPRQSTPRQSTSRQSTSRQSSPKKSISGHPASSHRSNQSIKNTTWNECMAQLLNPLFKPINWIQNAHLHFAFHSYQHPHRHYPGGDVMILLSGHQWIITFGGSTEFADWFHNAHLWQVPFEPWYQNHGEHHDAENSNISSENELNWNSTGVHAGFMIMYKTLRTPLLSFIQSYLTSSDTDHHSHHSIQSIVFCGHSMGGALAQLALVDVQQLLFRLNFKSLMRRTRLFTYGQPRVGNMEWHLYFKQWLHGGGVQPFVNTESMDTEWEEVDHGKDRVVRVMHREDLVPWLPLRSMQYTHGSDPYYWTDMKAVREGQPVPRNLSRVLVKCWDSVGFQSFDAPLRNESEPIISKLRMQRHRGSRLPTVDADEEQENLEVGKELSNNRNPCRFQRWTPEGHVSYFWNFHHVKRRCKHPKAQVMPRN